MEAKIENGKIINEKIKIHQEFLESLYNILKEMGNNNIKDNINKLNLPKDDEKQINIKDKNFEKEDKKTKIMRLLKEIIKIINNQEGKKNIFLNVEINLKRKKMK